MQGCRQARTEPPRGSDAAPPAPSSVPASSHPAVAHARNPARRPTRRPPLPLPPPLAAGAAGDLPAAAQHLLSRAAAGDARRVAGSRAAVLSVLRACLCGFRCSGHTTPHYKTSHHFTITPHTQHTLPRHVTPQVVRECLDPNPDKRPTMDALLCSPAIAARLKLLPAESRNPPASAGMGLVETIKVSRVM
jgi:hypothetical protein